MPLKRSIVRGLSFLKPAHNHNKPDHSTATSTSPSPSATTTTTPYFPPAPTKSSSIKKPWFVSGRQPATHPLLQPHQISSLTTLLSLPSHTPLLSTRIAALGPPLARPSFTNPPLGFCERHFWFEGRWIEELIGVIGEEIGPRLARLRRWGDEGGEVGGETREVLGVLEGYLHLFHTPGGEEGEGGSECHRDTCSICKLANCPACTVSLFLQNADAVRAVRKCAFGRKKKHEEWPEACMWLDPEPGSEWERRWRVEGNEILRDRANVQRCDRMKRADKGCRLSAESGESARSEYSRGSTGATSVASEGSSHLNKSSAAESLRDEYLGTEETAQEEKTWAEDFPVEEYTNKVNTGIFGSTRGTSVRRESFANTEDAKCRYPKFKRGMSVSRGPLSHMEDTRPRRLRSVRGTSAPKGAFFPNEAELTQHRSSKAESFSNEAELTQHRSSEVDYDTFLSKMTSGAEGEDDVNAGDEEDREVKEAAWVQSYERLTGEGGQTEWYRPCQPCRDYDTAEKILFF